MGDAGDHFPCAEGYECCGNVCQMPDGICCDSVGTPGQSKFACGPHSKCCGNMCSPHDSVCCTNSVGSKFACSAGGGGCCGNACRGAGSVCCTGPTGYKYPAAPGTC